MNLDFDFLVDEPDIPDVKDTKPIKMNKRMLVQDILDVYVEAGRKDWLRTQLKSDPRNYMELIKKLVPTHSAFDGMSDITVNLINRFGEKLQISAKGNTHAMLPPPRNATGEQGSGQPEIATGGNPIIKERYDRDNDST